MACKACRQRKVRCDGRPFVTCRQCVKHSLDCTYHDRQDRLSRLGVVRGATIARCVAPSSPSSQPSSHSAPLTLSPRYTNDFFHRLIPRFMTYIYPLCPVITEDEVRSHIRQRQSNEDSAALLYAWAGVVVFQANFTEMSQLKYDNEETSILVSQAIKHHQHLGQGSFTFTRLLISLFVAWCMLVLENSDSGFFYLQQAVTLLHILRMKCDDVTVDQDKLKTIYWLCFVHERTLAILFKTPICLDPLLALPPLSSHPLECGFHYMIQTFLLVDKSFLLAWRDDEPVTVTEGWIKQKHQELNDETWFFGVEQLPIVQQADLITTRYWLCTLLWQMAISHIPLSSGTASTNALSLTMPLHILSQERRLLSRTRPVEVIMHAFALLFRLFEITTTIADVLLLLPLCKDQSENKRRVEDFLFTQDFLLSLPSVKPVYRDALVERVSRIKRKYNLD